ncbi:FtsK/SpoIIIE domain-containing protein [Micromonospora echinofusca]|uniref:Cell division protein FtsK n=1 Tax=Micromonospora echinofusca TaxID=47858 RepID=A0ABS3VKE1_MICEH|nr:FtsK/SpoIIIE domain-containing protein [Micromonospora echinofusca]MBO4204985.1 cell division protein FtsK [Micromonospora echinofusca]
MASLTARTTRAAALHRQAAATVAAASAALDATRPVPVDQQRQYQIAERLRSAAARLVPGWAGVDLGEVAGALPPAGPVLPSFVRVGMAKPLDDAGFPALVPLLGTGHLTVDADARDPRVAGLLRAVLLRLIASAPAGSLLVRAVQGPGSTEVFAPFAVLADAGLLPPPATEHSGLRAVLAEAEQWVRPNAAGRRPAHDRVMLLMIAALPELVEPADLDRISVLAEQGPAAGLHLVVAGWPPPPLTPELTRPPLAYATPVTMRNPYALVGAPPGTVLGAPVLDGATGGGPAAGLNCPVFVDADPGPELIDRVCRERAAQIDSGRQPRLPDLLPAPDADLWTESGAEGLTTTVGFAAGRAVDLGFADLTPHWLVSGRSGSGRSAFLTNVIVGLAARYGPDELAFYLVDAAEGESFAECLQTERDRAWLPQVRAAGLEADREYVLAVLAELGVELERRADLCERAGVARLAALPPEDRPPRLVCVIESFHLLLAERDRLAVEVTTRLETLTRRGRPYGIHLVLAGDGTIGEGPTAAGQGDTGTGSGQGRRDPLLGQFPVRVALPGGGGVLAPANDAAAGLPLGSAVVNTAGGLGGPRGAVRGHERLVRFPDPLEDPGLVAALRHRLWSARPEGAGPPTVFAGYARPHLGNDPVYRAALAGRADGPVALLGRAVDVPRSPVGFPLDSAPGRHLAVFGATGAAARLLATAVRTVAAHHESGTARFVLAPLAAGTAQVAAGLAEELAERHQVTTVDGAGLLAALDGDQSGYLVVFGWDELPPADLPPRTDGGVGPVDERFTAVFRDGPARGVHLLVSGRETAAGAACSGGADGPGFGGVVLVDPLPAQLAGLPGDVVPERLRPGRALFRDVLADRVTVLVPYAESGVDG